WSASASLSGGGATAGVSYSSTSLENTRNSTTIATSSIVSEGNTVIDAGNRVRTEAVQADIGENLVIRGTNGIELLDAKEVYEEKVKQKTTTVGVRVDVAFTPAQMVSTVSDVINNSKDYGFGNSSQTINTIGNGIQDLRNVSELGGNLYDGIRAGSQYLNGHMNGEVLKDAKGKALSNLVSASVSASYSRSSSESNTNGINSVAGNINAGKNFVIQSDGDVKLVNQKVTVGDNFIVEANNFEALAGENAYKNRTNSKSEGISVDYDIINKDMAGGINATHGKSNTNSTTYDNTRIEVGGTFQLTTKEDARFAGVNVEAEKINFDIGKNLDIISLQDNYTSKGKDYSYGGSETLNGSYSQNNSDSKWVNNQTSVISENGGSVKAGETLTNVGSIIGSMNSDKKLSIEADKIIVENVKDHDKGENSGISVSGISKERLIPQIGIQYGSHDKEQDSNATFVNTEVTEAGKKLDLDELGINTDISKSQVVTKDEVVEQIDTVLHTDLGNQKVRDEFVEDILKTGSLVPEIVQGINEGIKNKDETILGQIANNMGERSDDIKAFVEGRDEKLQDQLDKYKNEKGELIYNEETKNLITENILTTLDEFGKGKYEVIYVKGDQNDPSMSINDEDGRVYVNVNGADFGDVESMRKTAQHEGSHGTYTNKDIDETSADRIGNNKGTATKPNIVIDSSMDEELEAGQLVYDKDREDEKLRDKSTIYYHPHKVGHIAIEVDGVVYSYGRYGDTWSSLGNSSGNTHGGNSSNSSGLSETSGEGVLVVIAKDKYIESYTVTKNEKVYAYDLNLSREEERNIVRFYGNLIANKTVEIGRSNSGGVAYTLNESEKYTITGNNCTTMVERALMANNFGVSGALAPGDYNVRLQDMLNDSGNSKMRVKINGKITDIDKRNKSYKDLVKSRIIYNNGWKAAK
ncbi:MAG: hemagglutinin repeat-containing protein, partial [Fusobacteriales bacterium]|nr:hemagglutinin repeat-containing protein [Fusobacteriales bacterium]